MTRRKRCTWQVAYGLPWSLVCGKPCRGLYCAEHKRDFRDLYPHLPVPHA